MKVICASYPKTGTKTLCAALNELGYNTYDWLQQSVYLCQDWINIVEHGGSIEDFRRMLKDVDAVTDSMGYNFWYEIHQAFPEAKIILTLRDEDSWWKSWNNQLRTDNKNWRLKVLPLFPFVGWNYFRFLQLSVRLEGSDIFWPRQHLHFNETLARLYYRRHNAYVKSLAPEDKLLVYNIKDGWEPLCRFLGKEVPNKPFPHKNKNASHSSITSNHPLAKRIQTRLKTVMFSMTITLGVACYVLYKSKHVIINQLLRWRSG